MKTQTCLYVREDGKILIFDKPAHFYSDHPDENQSKQYQSALKEAIGKAVECADQDSAKDMIHALFSEPRGSTADHKPEFTIKPGVYPIPGITYEVREKDCWDCVECNHPNDCKESTELLAYITATDGTAPVLEKEYFKCPECGTEIGYGLNEVTKKAFEKSKLFTQEHKAEDQEELWKLVSAEINEEGLWQYEDWDGFKITEKGIAYLKEQFIITRKKV